MYLLAAETEIDWVLGKTSSVIVVGDLDLLIIKPDGVTDYLTAPILPGNFTAPTPTTEGAASYLFTPQLEGLYKIRLVTGTALLYTILSKVEMYVFDSSTTVAPLHQLKNTIADEKTLSQPGDLKLIEGEIRWYPTRRIEIRRINCSLGLTALGRDVLIDVKKNGISILNSNLTVVAGQNFGVSQIPLDPLVLVTDYITVDVLQLGSLRNGANLMVGFKYD